MNRYTLTVVVGCIVCVVGIAVLWVTGQRDIIQLWTPACWLAMAMAGLWYKFGTHEHKFESTTDIAMASAIVARYTREET